MKHLSRWLLRAVTTAVPVVIAACYGMMYRFSRNGKVVDATTSAGINGIRVACLNGGNEASFAYTDTAGQFVLDYDSCQQVKAEDVDGADNGAYQPKTIDFPAGTDDILISLDKVN